MNRLHLSFDARTDLEEIREYISIELENPSAAANTIARITKELRILRSFAQAGAPLSSITNIQSEYRYLTVGNYMVFYRVLGPDVFIDRILYGKRNYLRTLLGNNSEQDSQ
ncbi:MAG: type II toxin-antitoxin system RelE/ParE family toxin [Candidatus Limivicinus sp.]